MKDEVLLFFPYFCELPDLDISSHTINLPYKHILKNTINCSNAYGFMKLLLYTPKTCKNSTPFLQIITSSFYCSMM